MATETQIIANQPNAQKSTGPRSPRLATNDQRLTTNYAKQTQTQPISKGAPMLLRLTINGRRESFGYYADGMEAAKAYDRVAVKYHDQFAGLNFVARCTGHKSRTNCFGQFFAVFV